MPELTEAVVTARQDAGCWDYAVITVHARHNEALEACLKERGREGWELVFMYEPVPNDFRCVLKRPAR